MSLNQTSVQKEGPSLFLSLFYLAAPGTTIPGNILNDASPFPSKNRAKKILDTSRKLLQKELDELSLGDALKRISGYVEGLFSEENLKQEDENLKANMDDKVSFKQKKSIHRE